MTPPRPPRPPRPRKRFGQHFLTDRALLARIADALELKPGETAVEIGPGRGALTEELASRATKLVAIEVDRDLAAILRERYAARPHVTIVEKDVLDVPLGEIGGRDYALAGNIPYNITTPIIFHALEPPMFSRAVFLVQKEVADRLSAAPGSGEYGALTVNVAARAKVETLFRVPPGAFNPPPKVDSAVVRLRRRETPLFPDASAAALQRFVIDVFTKRRKQLRGVLRELSGWPVERIEQLLGECGIDPMVRAETLAPEQFARLGLALRSP